LIAIDRALTMENCPAVVEILGQRPMTHHLYLREFLADFYVLGLCLQAFLIAFNCANGGVDVEILEAGDITHLVYLCVFPSVFYVLSLCLQDFSIAFNCSICEERWCDGYRDTG
jgi:hypothetical protein